MFMKVRFLILDKAVQMTGIALAILKMWREALTDISLAFVESNDFKFDQIYMIR
jgi:hypothetical protein